MYGSHCWTLRKTEEDKLHVFEREVLRKIYGPIYDQGIQLWRKRHNQELIDIFKRPSIVNEIKRSRLEWTGHACRKQNAMLQKVLQEDPRSKRPLGRPRLRWEDGIRKHFLNARGKIMETRTGRRQRRIEKNGREFVVWQDGLKSLYKKKNTFNLFRYDILI